MNTFARLLNILIGICGVAALALGGASPSYGWSDWTRRAHLLPRNSLDLTW
jgi:hypothetical protein